MDDQNVSALLDRIDEQREELDGLREELDKKNQRRLVRLWTSETEFTVINPNAPGWRMLFKRDLQREPDDSDEDAMRLFWYAAGRPGKDDPDPEKAIEDWYLSIYEVEWITVERGKVTSQTLPA